MGSSRRWNGFVAAMGMLVLAAGASAVAPASSAPAEAAPAASVVRAAPAALAGKSSVNPLSLAGGFTVYAKEDATLANTEFEGSIAVGDRLRVTQTAQYQFAHVIAGTGAYTLPTVDGDPTRVLIGAYASNPTNNFGRVQITNTGATEPSQFGDLKIVDRDEPFVSFTRGDWLRYALSTGSDDPPLIDAENQTYPDDAAPPATSAGNGSIYTYDNTGSSTQEIVARYVQADADANEAEITQCLADIADPSTGIGYPVSVIEDAGDRVVLGPLAPDQPNIVEYDDIAGAGQLQFSDGAPGPSNPLIIHVSPGTTSIMPPGIDPQGTYSPYVLWDLSQVTGTVDIETGGRGDGSIYAPDARLDVVAEPWDGQILADALTFEGGEVHSYLFAGSLPCDAPLDAGTFSVAKELSGVDAADLADGTAFQVRYVALEPGGTVATGVLALNPDGTPASPADDFPFGTRVTLVEIAPSDDVLPPELAWTDVTWSGDTTFVIDATHPSFSLTVTDTAETMPAGFNVTKAVTGSGATIVPSDAEFTLEYTVNGGDPIDLTVLPEEPAMVDGLAAGDVITIDESGLPDVEGVSWGEPAWTVGGEPVAPDESGAVSFTLIGDESISLELANTAQAVGWAAISKSVVGNASSLVPDDTTFPIVYTLDGGAEQTLEIPIDQTVTFDALPAGTVVTVREDDLPVLPGIEWGTPGWTVDGTPQTPDASGAITFVVQPGATVALSLTNTANGFGSLTALKTVSGDGSDLVPADTSFPIEYRVSNGPVQTAELVAGTLVTAEGLPTGIPVSVRETAPPAIPGVAWGEPTWTIDGVVQTPDDDGWVSFVPATGTTVALELDNTADLAPGGFTITKTVTGETADLVPDGTEFTVTYRVNGGAEQTLVLALGEATAVADVPVGATVEFSEATPPAIDGVEWGSPVWQIDGVTTDDPTITVGAGASVAVGLQNTATTTHPHLPSTGFDAGAAPLAAILAVLVGGAAIVLSRLRRRTARRD
ncbi:choice-of-anchor A domain-containing protein [Agromyces terreus]|uniref:Choice-of-anchor A domain-containing protein n=1 Tax=Agromyces terreus TaxID=424795 RepID=A0A9X2H4H0_9MICO|nr:DUF5979 domain-containing protein [Agromyces terreus]MCP2372363.1 choice-of-anchor A domain-containing protein [Agromyces terreus]